MPSGKMLWIDVLTPKQALFTASMLERCPSRIRCVVTTRDYSELNQFVKQIGLQHASIGRHGGGDLLSKLRASVARQSELIEFVSTKDFDYSFSFMSPEASRVSFGLGVKHFICSDSPHSVAPSKLTVPLASALFTSFAISKKLWTSYGIESRNVLQYHAIDPWVWLGPLRLIGKGRKKGRVLVRLEETLASYFKHGRGLSDVLSQLVLTIKSASDFEILLVPRYDEQRSWAKKKFGTICTVPDTTIKGPGEIAASDLVIGGGGTMAQEAALLGVPNISYFPSAKLHIFEDYLFPRKLSIKASTPIQLLRETKRLLESIDQEKKELLRRAKKETRDYEDPVKFIFKKLLEV